MERDKAKPGENKTIIACDGRNIETFSRTELLAVVRILISFRKPHIGSPRFRKYSVKDFEEGCAAKGVAP